MTTPLAKMRKFHNYIKKTYLNKYVNEPSTLLDLASGKGGDILKWKQNKNIKSVIGYDIDEDSVKEAKKRLKNINVKIPVRFKVTDLSKNVVKCDKKHDVITSHFAFHYFFRNKKTLDTILESIDNCSKIGSTLILTLLDGSKIEDVRRDDYRLTILDPHKKSNYGKRVEVFIKGSVLDKPEIEYLVQPKFLEKKLKDVGFKLIESKSFSELYDKDKFNLSNDEKRYSFMNRIYVFKKIL